MSGSVILCLSWKCSVDAGVSEVDTFGSRYSLKDGFTAQKLEDVQRNSEWFVKIAMNSTDEYGFPGVLNTYKFLNT